MADVDKNITRFIQDTEPDQPNEGDLWWDGGNVSIYLGNGTWVEPNVERGYSVDPYNVSVILGGFGNEVDQQSGDTFVEKFDMATNTIKYNGIQFNKGNIGVISAPYQRDKSYVMGGISLDLSTVYSTIEWWSFANESFSTDNNNMGASFRSTGTLGNLNKTYILGGYNGDTSANVSSINKISNGSWSGQVNTLSAAEYYISGVRTFSSGYHIGGCLDSGIANKFGKFDYDNDSAAIVENNLSVERTFAGALYSSQNGYVVAGWNKNADTYLSSVEKIDFSSDSSTSVVGNSAIPLRPEVQTSNSTVAGYIFGGSFYYSISSIQRYVFSADMSTMTITNTLHSAKTQGNAFSSAINNGLIY